MIAYEKFLESKAQADSLSGFDPVFMPSDLFDFQSSLVEWAVRKGRAAIFADCGLGKTLMELTWAENVLRHTNKPVLILTPLAVAAQTVREGVKFGIEAKRSPDGKHGGGIELKASYYRQMLRNIENAEGSLDRPEAQSAFEFADEPDDLEAAE